MAPSLPNLSIKTAIDFRSRYSDSRQHGYQGPTRVVRLARVTPSGGGWIAKSEDGSRCAVTGNESLRIVRVSAPPQSHGQDHKSATGRGGHRIDASRNFWDGSGLKVDSTSTDVGWGHGVTSNKIMTSARNGELIMWDLNKSGSTKFERRIKDHSRAVNKLSISPVVPYYCVTASADGAVRVWDLRDLTKSLMRVQHPAAVRSVVFSSCQASPLQAVAGLDNGTLYRWDFKMGPKGLLDRLPLAHTASITSLDWRSASVATSASSSVPVELSGNCLGWLVSSSLDRTVKVWDLDSPASGSGMPHKPTYSLHPSFPVRRVVWRPGYDCELALVSNTDFATGSNPDLMPSTNIGTLNTLGLDLASRRSRTRPSSRSSSAKGKSRSLENRQQNPAHATPSVTGDAIEIWDVRRGLIAKWRASGSAIEGGATDVVFGDSHAIWAQHYSGMFSQLDLRERIKPLDAIPRVSTTWNAFGAITFVSDRVSLSEIPYDDMDSGKHVPLDKKYKVKALGDGKYEPESQSMGTVLVDHAAASIAILAQQYVAQGFDRSTLCVMNAHAAMQSGFERAAQAWWLLGASLTDVLPDGAETTNHVSDRKTSNVKASPSSFAHSVSAPAAISDYSFPPHSNDTAPVIPHRSPLHRPANSLDGNNNFLSPASSVALLKNTPTSSNSSSPSLYSSNLPPSTPRASLMVRRPSNERKVNAARRPSTFRRPSISIRTESPAERPSSSLRLVGEGALEDSDSSGEEEEKKSAMSSEEEINLRPLVSPALGPVRSGSTHTAPLTRLNLQQKAFQPWTEDEDDESSPSPQSSDTDSDGPKSSLKRSKSGGRPKRRGLKSRSRSSTLASLSAPKVEKTLTHQTSQSSIRTIIAAETSFQLTEDRTTNSARGLSNEETIRDLGNSHTRSKSVAVASDPALGSSIDRDRPNRLVGPGQNRRQLSGRHPDVIRSDEKRFREIAFGALRALLSEFADEGEVQMCAMMSVIAPKELKVSPKTMTRYLEAYLDMLTRLRLHSAAAYVRKYCSGPEVSEKSSLETMIYTSCAKCRKPLLLPAGNSSGRRLPRGGFSYCLSCRTPCVRCSICHLPVQTLLFHCSVCGHGGHQTCYNRYYMRRPMKEILKPKVPDCEPNDMDAMSLRNVQPSSSPDDSMSVKTVSSQLTVATEVSDATTTGNADTNPKVSSETNLLGHPCAAGCGHFCWIANQDRKTSVEEPTLESYS